MESTLAASSSGPGPVTFSHVFGQQCQLMEAGRKPMERGMPRGKRTFSAESLEVYGSACLLAFLM